MADNRKSVLITGCSAPGIGYHLAQVFLDRGFRVFATARKAETIVDLKAKGCETLSLVVDDEESVKACFKQVCQLLGDHGLDFLVNNAGRNYTVPATDIELSEVRTTFETNLFSVMQINSLFLPLLLRSRGTIVHIGSVAGYMPYIFGSVYNASKAALHHYCNTLRIELAPFGVHVLTIVTGGVRSNIARTKRTLPEGSLYQTMSDKYEYRLTHSQTMGVDTRMYAEQVVRASLNSRGWLWNQNQVWLGGSAGLVWGISTLDWYWPGGLWTLLMPSMFGMKRHMEVPESKKKV